MTKKILKYLFRFFAVVILITTLYFSWLNIGTMNSLKLKVISVLPTPIALINNHIIWFSDFTSYLKETFKPQGSETAFVNKTNLNAFFKSKALAELNLKDDQENIGLKIKYHQKNYLSSGAERIFNITADSLKNGTSFSVLNREYDQDPYSKTFLGDLGYLDTNKILPEILKELDSMNVGDIRPIASRYGWHIILIEDKDLKGEGGGQRFHLKQIFIKVNGFDQWLVQETKKITIINLINF